MDQIQLDGGVLLFTTVVSIAVALAFGLLPALHASRGDLRDSLQRVGRHHRQPVRPPPAERRSSSSRSRSRWCCWSAPA